MSRAFFDSRYKVMGGKIKSVRLRDSFRVNTLTADDEKVVNSLKNRGVIVKKVPFLEHAYFYYSNFSLGSTPEFLSGQIYIQDVASMLPAVLLNPSKRDRVLDMCASPGSKTTQLSQLMSNRGLVVAVEKNPARLSRLKLNLERQSCTNVIVYNKDVLNFKSEFLFDKILLDAPCSGNYTQDKDWFDKRTLAGIIENSKYQRKLIKKAFNLLKPKGTLIYSTCSLEPEEDELVVDYALKLGFKLNPISIPLGSEGLVEFNGLEFDKSLKLARRLWPFKDRTQGFFIAKLVKGEDK